MPKLALLVLVVVSCACGPVTSAEARTFKCNPAHPQFCSAQPPDSSHSGSASPTPSLSPSPSPSPSPAPSPIPVPASSGTPGPLGQTGNWNLIFGDEFGGTALDRTKWTPGWFGTGITGPVNSSELACYDSAHVVERGDGNLHLTLDATANTCKGYWMPFTGALISSNTLFQYADGYVEFRVYQPAASPGRIGNWPATWSDGQSWPADGENDTMEGLGGLACYHFHSTSGGPGSCASGDYSGWHTYASYWQSGVVTYFYDGVQVGKITSGITTAPQYLIVDYTISPSSVALVPSEMLVDYVRVWTPA
jgi:beta-glucanase (GH16 family)